MDDTLMSPARRGWAWALASIAALPLLVSLLLGSVYFFATFQPIYEREQRKYDVAQVIGTDEASLSHITSALILYMSGDRQNLSMSANIGGVSREVFSDKEKAHMSDVLYLFDLLRVTLNICAPLSIALVAIASQLFPVGRRAYLTARSLMSSLAICLLVAVAVSALAAFNFESAFVGFHHAFFTNDLWLLNPDTDVLIQMMPLGFFVDMAAVIGATFLGVAVIIIMGCALTMLATQRKPAAAVRPDAQQIFDSMGIADASAVPDDVKTIILRDEREADAPEDACGADRGEPQPDSAADCEPRGMSGAAQTLPASRKDGAPSAADIRARLKRLG